MPRTPLFWYPSSSGRPVIALGLWPLSLIWRGAASIRRLATTPYRPKTHTIVIGNLTAGGAGKTPVVASLARAAIAAKRHPVILTRGYGGYVKGPHVVTDDDLYHQIGDEARWISKIAPVVVARDRGAGARWIDENMSRCDLIIMDDGLQNPTIIPHQSVAVFNGRMGTGNGMIIPAGPMREGWGRLKSCDAVVITGEDHHNLIDRAKAINPDLHILAATRHLRPDDLGKLKNKPVFAFAGIAAPQGFFDMLNDAGIKLAGYRSFPDHYPYTSEDYAGLKKDAAALGAMLVTTEKDMMRLNTHPSDHIASIGLDTHINPSIMDIIPPTKV